MKMKKTPHTKISRNFRHAKLFGIIFITIGCLLSIHGGVSLYKLYHPNNLVFVVEQGLSPEKGQMWVKLITGASVMLLGVALMLTAGKRKNEASLKHLPDHL